MYLLHINQVFLARHGSVHVSTSHSRPPTTHPSRFLFLTRATGQRHVIQCCVMYVNVQDDGALYRKVSSGWGLAVCTLLCLWGLISVTFPLPPASGLRRKKQKKKRQQAGNGSLSENICSSFELRLSAATATDSLAKNRGMISQSAPGPDNISLNPHT